ncbi:divisome protein SepX/GlpR [Micromonospora wenchangensis]|uniref:divisome protein SepX/GlpR n=1 Tax=Micromonospora wenchangensis TaxID=1185415 RepID=UPI0038076622
MRVPTSVLLAVLAAAGLLALAPALVRRYDATERLVAERAQSTARVLQRRRRRRTVPGRRPVNQPRALVVTLAEDAVTGNLGVPVSAPPAPARRPTSPAGRRSGRLRAVPPTPRQARRRPSRRHTPAVYRRRRVLAALLLLNFVELVGVIVVSPGFWISFSVTVALLAVYVVHLRRRALAERRRRRLRAREAAWLAARQAEVRREQARRAAARREAQRRLAAQREAVRRTAMGLDRPSDLPAAASGGGSVSYRRSGGLRGRPYQSGRDPR